MMKKPNPRNKPATKADVKKAYDRGVDRGIMTILAATLYVLQDKHGAAPEQLQAFRDELMYAVDSIGQGYLSVDDILTVLKEEYGVELELK